VTNLRYTYDMILLASSEAQLQELVDRLDSDGRRYSPLTNIDKTKVLATGTITCHICTIDGSTQEQIDAFPYLGSLITLDTECSKEIRSRLAKGHSIVTTL